MIEVGTVVRVLDIHRTDSLIADISVYLGEFGVVEPSTDPDDPGIGLNASSPLGFHRGSISFRDGYDLGERFFASVKVEVVS